MKKADIIRKIIRKITSRKLWLAIALFVSGVLTATGHDKSTVEQVSGLIMQGAAVISYIVGEGLIDAASAGGKTNMIAPEKDAASAGGDTYMIAPEKDAESKEDAE